MRDGRWRGGIAAAAVALAALPPAVAAAAPPAAAFVPGEVIVAFDDGATAAARRAAVDDVRGRLAPGRVAEGVRVVRVPGGSPPAAARDLERAPGVDWAEPNYLYRRSATPNDPGLPQQWSLVNSGQPVLGTAGTPGADIGAAAAWDVATGSPGVRLAVVDGGVDATHPDLAPNFARPANVAETGGGRESNGVDDDANGLVDDFRGWDWVADDNDPRDEDSVGHGTHAAGVAAARGNDGFGVAGVSWQARLIALRALNSTGTGTAADIAAAIAYANQRGARILNASFGGPALSQAISDAIADAPNMLVVAAAGNAGADVDGGAGSYPCALTLPNVVCVAATDQNDLLAGFSNSGSTSVDLAAPGTSIMSTAPGGGHQFHNGTSFSAPLVAGAAALVLGANPAASTAQLRGAVLAGVDVLPSLAGLVATAGRLDAGAALAGVPPPAPGPGVATGAAAEVAAAGARLTGQATGRGQRTSTYFEWGPTTAYGEQTATRSAGAATGPVPMSDAVGGLAAGTTYHYRAVAVDGVGISFGADATFTTTTPAPAGPPAPVLRVRRVGRAWFLIVRLGEPATVSGRLERRAVSLAGRPGRFRGVKVLRARALAAGEARVPLGRLAHGAYRVSVSAAGAGGTAGASRRFRAVVPLPARARPVGGGTVAVTVVLGRRAVVGARLERRRGRGFAIVRRYRQQSLPAGSSRIRLTVPGSPGAYRVRLVAVGGEGTRVGVAPFRLG